MTAPMSITTIQPYHLSIPPAAAVRSSADQLAVNLVRVGCDDGAVVWGEAGWEDAAEVAEAVAVLAPVVIGADPLDRGALWERMVDRLTSFDPPLAGGAAALSAIDIALWDLAGRALGLPVYRLLGGRRLARLDVYAAGPSCAEPDVAAQQAQEILERGFRALKIEFGAGPEGDLAVLEAVRKALGPEVLILVDVDQGYEDLDTALRMGAELDRREVFWYEEPLPPGDWRDYVALRHALDTPLAGGKRLRSPGAFVSAFRAGALDIATPDVRLCGGITGLVKTAELARWFGVRISPHNGASSLGVIASAHVALTLPNCLMTEVAAALPFMEQGLLDPPLSFEDGFLVMPDGPGLGVTVNEQLLQEFAADT